MGTSRMGLSILVDPTEYAKNFIVGKGTYLVAYHNQGYTNINETYLRLLRYASIIAWF
ncbi:hypothetical protein PAEVO_10810 [Paenibacillus sp. GM2FR]|nr:hypothetical protein PAEVO_10810 [Paenibacillus sp. GM2FR]